MKKQSVRSFVLRALAHQMQHLIDFVFRMTEEDTVLSQVTSNNVDVGSVESASHAVFSALPAVSPSPLVEEASDDTTSPTHWLERRGTDGPPTDWLRRVQKGAPELLAQSQLHQSVGRGADFRSSTAPGSQTQRPAVVPLEHSSGEALDQANGESEGVRQDTQDASLKLQMTEVHDADQTLDVVYRDELIVQQEANEPKQALEGGRRGASTHRQRTEEDVDHRVAGEIQRGILKHRQMLTEDTTRQVTDVARRGETNAYEPGGNWWSESNRQSFAPVEAYHVDQNPLRHVLADRATPPDLSMQHGKVDMVQQDKTLVHSGEIQEHAEWQEVPRQGEVPAISVLSQTKRSPWSRTSYGVATARVSDAAVGASQSDQLEMSWPALPMEVTNPRPDGEGVVRAWERQKRLDEEQRGSAWTV